MEKKRGLFEMVGPLERKKPTSKNPQAQESPSPPARPRHQDKKKVAKLKLELPGTRRSVATSAPAPPGEKKRVARYLRALHWPLFQRARKLTPRASRHKEVRRHQRARATRTKAKRVSKLKHSIGPHWESRRIQHQEPNA